MQQLLDKGLSYVPDKEKEDISDLISDIDSWGRRLKLKVHFDETNINQSDTQNESDTNCWKSKPPSKIW